MFPVGPRERYLDPTSPVPYSPCAHFHRSSPAITYNELVTRPRVPRVVYVSPKRTIRHSWSSRFPRGKRAIGSSSSAPSEPKVAIAIYAHFSQRRAFPVRDCSRKEWGWNAFNFAKNDSLTCDFSILGTRFSLSLLALIMLLMTHLSNRNVRVIMKDVSWVANARVHISTFLLCTFAVSYAKKGSC